MRGVFIVFEGGEGCGKSTQAAKLAAHLDAVLTREPGGTPLGVELRALLLGRRDDAPSPRAEALLMAADRAHHVATLVGPALGAGRHVVSDRYLGSSVAYQGAARGLGADAIRELSLWAADGLEPDLVVLLQVDEEVAWERLGAPSDRLEAEGMEFHRAVAAGFAAQAAGDDRWVVLDGSGEVDAVAAEVRRVVWERLGVPETPKMPETSKMTVPEDDCA